MDSYTFQVRTSWGTAQLTMRDGVVAELRPPTKVPQVQCASAVPSTTDADVNELQGVSRRLIRYFDDGDLQAIAIPEEELDRRLDGLGIEGFRARVMRELARVPAGTTVTYGELAQAVGNPGAARAVGTVCARNPLPLLVPCHRVVAASGKLGAFSFEGPEYKSRLLAHEGVRLGAS
jgi:O-6-methylguanine DNA methyltransferase